MPKGTEDQVGFLAPQSKQILLASCRFSFSKMLCETVLGARADIVAIEPMLRREVGYGVRWRTRWKSGKGGLKESG